MSEREVWDKLKAPPRKRIRFSVATHFIPNKTGDGWLIEGTDKPVDPKTHVERVIWIYEDDWSACDPEEGYESLKRNE